MVSSLQLASHQAALPYLTFDLMEMTANLLSLTGLTLGIKDTITLRYAGQAICNSIRREAYTTPPRNQRRERKACRL
jgi:hypothetical protein